MIHNERINIIISETGARTVKREIDAMGAIAQRSNNRLMYWISILKDNIALLGAAGIAAGAALAGLGFALFERNMLAVQVATQATESQMQALNATARRTALEYGVMANEVALGMDSLARAGVSAAGIQEGAMEAALVMARATGGEIEEGANVAANAMLVYGVAAEEMMRVVQGGAAYINLTTRDLNDYRLAIANAGQVAHSMRIPFEEFNAVLAATASGFSSGATQGTAFRTFLMRLSPSSGEAKAFMEALGLEARNANGELKSMAEIADELNRVFGAMNSGDQSEMIQQVFGLEGYRFVVNMMAAGGDTIRRYQEEIIPATDATEMARVRMQGLAGAFFYALAAVEEFAIATMENGWGKAFEIIIRGMADAVIWLGHNLDKIEPLVASIATMIALHWGGKALRWVFAMDGAIALLGRRMNWLTAMFAANPWLLLAGAIVGVSVALYNLSDDIKVTSDGMVSMRDAASVVWDDIVAGAGDMAGEVLGLFREMTRGVNGELNEIGEENESVWEWAGQKINDFVVTSILALFRYKAQVSVLWEEIRNIFDGDGVDWSNIRERMYLAGADGLREGAEYIRNFEQRARERAGQRAEEEARGDARIPPTVPGDPPDLPDLDSTRSRAEMIADFNREIDNNTFLLSRNIDERRSWAEILRLNEQLLSSEYALLSGPEKQALLDRLMLLQRESDLQNIRDEVYQQQTETLRGLYEQQLVYNELLERGTITVEYFNEQIRRTNMEMLELRINSGQGTFADGFLLELNRMLQGVERFQSNAGQSFGKFFTTLADGFANSVGRAIVYSEDLGTALQEVARGALAELISMLVKMALQWVINATIGNAMQAATAETSIAMAEEVASAWAPAAAEVSLATFGENAIGAAAALVAIHALSQGLAVPGYAAGGLVSGPGTGTSDSILAALSNGEFVVNAAATRNNLPALMAMNDGKQVGGGASVTMINSSPTIVIQGDASREESQANGRAAAEAYETAFVAMVRKHKRVGGVLAS